MWVSTGNAGLPNQDITTDAVLCPTAGNASSSSKVCGTSPLYFSTRIFESPAIPLDFIGDRPQGLMISRISSAEYFIISCGLFASLNNVGVVLLTRSSVHWAESKTEIN